MQTTCMSCNETENFNFNKIYDPELKSQYLQNPIKLSLSNFKNYVDTSVHRKHQHARHAMHTS